MNTIVIPSHDKKIQMGIKNLAALNPSRSSGGKEGLRNMSGKAVRKEKANPMIKPSRVPQIRWNGETSMIEMRVAKDWTIAFV